MTIADVVKILNGKLMAGDGTSPRAVGAVVANDLMSDVLLNDADDILLITSLASDQAIRTAHIVGAMGVVVHNAKPLSETMLKVAADLGVPLVTMQNKGFSKLEKPTGRYFDACAAGRLLMLAPAAWPYTPGHKPMARHEATAMNRLCQWIAGEGAATINYRGLAPANIDKIAIAAASKMP